MGDIPNYLKFLFSGVAGMAASVVVQPLDLVKTRMQVSGTKQGAGTVIRNIMATEGVLAFYNGLGAALLRQATYTTTRLGVYNNLNEIWMKTGSPPNFLGRIVLGMAAGAIGACVGTPAEVVLIRMTSDGRLPPSERRNYKNVVHALSKIIKEEGVAALWRGMIPTMSRAVVVNGAQLSSYSQAKQTFLELGFEDNIKLHFTASMISGLFTTICSMPVDIAKTRIQNMKIVDGKPEYKGGMDVIMTILKKEGPLKLWSGFLPYFGRVGPHTVLTFIFLERLNKMYKDRSK
ncbi:hypothetical protein FQA39_LY01392 [Lamprigera yunnana]|nr:hypothetical protein FQA39_LY01392 [Lamprigera yunnana]